MKRVLSLLLFPFLFGACSQNPTAQGNEKDSEFQVSGTSCTDLVTNIKKMSGLSEQMIVKKIVLFSQNNYFFTPDLASACLDKNLTINCTQSDCIINERK